MKESTKCMDWFPTDMEFVVELQFTRSNEETAAKLLQSLYGDNELLPGLKVMSIHCKAHGLGQVGSQMLLDQVQEAYLEFQEKVQNLIGKNWNERLNSNGESPYDSIQKINHRDRIIR